VNNRSDFKNLRLFLALVNERSFGFNVFVTLIKLVLCGQTIIKRGFVGFFAVFIAPDLVGLR
jgi:hypothetical protein